ncbi:MAG: glycosyltransferase family 2 protein [Planctomycetales bacterium]|nr:glycosyltransferase family 2 protein [Planctomycetales bacterium]
MGRTAPKVAIVLATWNGGQFLPDQLRSIQQQSFADWQLWVRDDGSDDATCEVLQSFAAADSRMHVERDDLGRLGCARNFGELLRRASENQPDYVFLADQDDVWLPHKVARQLAVAQAAECEAGRDLPLLVHTDASAVDADLQPVHASLVRHLGLRPETPEPLRTLLVQNFVTGCATVINRALLELALPFPDTVVLHDWWLAQCAAAAGELRFVSDPLVMYRQHASNQVGACGAWRKMTTIATRGWQGFRDQQDLLQRGVAQARSLDQRLRDRFATDSIRAATDIVGGYLDLFEPHHSRWHRPGRLLNLRIGRQMWLRQAALLVQVGLLPPAGERSNDGRAA